MYGLITASAAFQFSTQPTPRLEDCSRPGPKVPRASRAEIARLANGPLYSGIREGELGANLRQLR